MSDSNSYNAINNVGKTIANLLFINLANDSKLKSIFNKEENQENQVSLASPKEIETETAKLSIFLYNVTEFSSMKNTPPNPPKQNPSLYLKLHYLITPHTKDQNNDQAILGKVMQTFLDNPVLRGSILQGNLADEGEAIRVTLDSLSLDDLNKLWTIFSTPYKLSISFSVSPVKIEPSGQPEDKTVIEKTSIYKLRGPST